MPGDTCDRCGHKPADRSALYYSTMSDQTLCTSGARCSERLARRDDLLCTCDPAYANELGRTAEDPCGHGDTSEGCPRHDGTMTMAERVEASQ